MNAALICPKCGHEQTETIPSDSCLPFYTCKECEENIQAKDEDCCVFCSYGDKNCPVSHEEPIKTEETKEKESSSCPCDKNKPKNGQNNNTTQAAVWILAVLVLFVAAFAFGWEVFYGYVVPQTNNLASFSTLGLFVFAATAGIMVNLGPCSLAVLPAYMSYYISLDQNIDNPVKEGLKLGAIASVGVFSFYIVLGIAFAALGTYLSQYSAQLKLIIATIILALGIYMLAGKAGNIKTLGKLKKYLSDKSRGRSDTWGLLGFGVIYAAGGLSCFLPVFLPLVFFPLLSGQFFVSIMSFIIFAGFQALFLIGATIAIAYGRKKVFIKLAGHSRAMKKLAGVVLIITAFIMYGIYIFLGM